MNNKKTLILIGLIIVFIGGRLLLLIYEKDKLKKEIQTQSRIIDSLKNENFAYELMLTEYDIMYESVDSVCRMKIDSAMLEIE